MRKPVQARDIEHETLLRALAETTTAALFVLSGDQITYANPAAARVSGYSASELTGRSFSDLIQPEDRIWLSGSLQPADGIPQPFLRREIRLRARDGQVRWLVLTAEPLPHLAEGLWVMTGLEVTQPALERPNLPVEQQRLQTLLASLPIAVWIADASGRIVEQNSMVRQIWGEGAPFSGSVDEYREYRGTWADTGKPVQPHEWAMACALREGKPIVGQLIDIERFDGRRATILNSAAPIFDSTHTLVGAVAVSQDITDQRDLERRLRNALDEADRQASELQVIFSTLTDTVLVYNSEGLVMHANPAAARLYGFDPTGRRLSDLYDHLTLRQLDGAPIPPEQWPSTLALRGQTVKSQPMILLNQRGQEYRMVLSSAPLALNGLPIGAVTTMHDVTERERLLEENARRAEQLNAVIQSMVESVIIFNGEGVAVMANRSVIESFGFNPTGLSLKEVFRQIDLHTPDGIPVRLNQIPILQALQGQPVIGERYVYTNRHKKRLTMLLSVAPITSDESFNGAVVVWHDVTEREQLVNQLEAERARLSAVIANAPEAILVADQKARIILANPLAERLYGWPIPYGEPYTARSRQRICYPNGEDYDPRDLPLTRAALDGEVVTNVEATVLLPDGGRRELLINAAPIFDRNGQPAGAIAVSQDIGSRKQIEAEIRKNAARAEVLSSLSQSFAEAGLYYAAVLSTITHQITEQIGDGSLIRLTSDDERWLDVVAMHHPENESLSSLRRVLRKRRLRTHEGVAGLAYQSHRPVLIHRSMAEQYRQPLVEEFDSWIHDNAPESILVVPLQAQGRLIGTLTVVRPRGGSPYTPDDQIFFMSLADRAALAIENAVLFADEARRAHELDALHSATVELLGTLDIDHLLTKIMNAAQSAIPVAERGALHLLEPQTGELAVRATLNPTDLRITHIARPDAHDFTSAVMRSRETLTVNDVQANLDGLTFDQLTAGEPPTFRALIAAPLMMGEDAIGVLSLTSSRPFAFNKDDVRLLKTFAATTSAAIQNAMLHAKVQTLAITDPLTEQYNRRGFFDLAQREMERFSRYQYPLAAIMLDIDHFKHVNDTHGHRVGDRVLRSLADRINQNIRQVDILGRYGGEEFVILLPETELFKACEIAERIRSAVSAEAILESENGPIQVTVSLGVTRATRGTSSLPELLEQADKALYQAKQNGRNRVEVM